MLLDMKSLIEAMRALAYFTAGKMDVAKLSADKERPPRRRALSTC